ncbi:MAG: SRPBCC domain-containing protein [Alphaproteobacteria bacterium]|nr:SRPBCC domain-containing protein [Alphaproteobacteria bacterium]
MADPIVLKVSRHFDAPPETVFDAWLNPEAAQHFLFATDTGIMQTVEIEPRVGGKFLIVERRGDVEAEHFGAYLEIDRPRRLVFTFAALRDQGTTRVQLDFKAERGGCLVTLTHEMDPQWAEYADRTREGWTTILGRAERALGRIAATVSRVIAAPRHLVYAAWTESGQLAKWWGPNDFSAPVCEIDPRPGGVIYIQMQPPEGGRNTVEGRVQQAIPNERLVFAANLRDPADGLMAKTHTVVTFADKDGGTEVSLTQTAVPYRDFGPDFPDGMREGSRQTLDKLAAMSFA